MSEDLEREVARRTGETLHTIRQRGFGPAPGPLHDDEETDVVPVPVDPRSPATTRRQP